MGISHASYTGEAPAIGRVDNLFDPLIRAPLVAASIVITFQSGLRAPRSRRIRGALSQPSTSATMFAGDNRRRDERMVFTVVGEL